MPRDKFASMKKAQAQAAPAAGRGKFGKNFGAASAASAAGGASGSSGNAALGDAVKPSAKIESTELLRQRLLKRKRETKERQLPLLQDLDKAEELTLQLLGLAASTTQELALATIDDVSEEEQKKRWDKCQSFGDEYMQKVKELHSLLSPHAHYVVAYKNHAVDVEGSQIDNKNQSQKEGNNKNVEATNAKKKSGDSVGESKLVKTSKADDSSGGEEEEVLASTKLELGHTRNMYAARVERRLAIERREVLREMLRLEKEQLKSQS